MRGRRSGLSLLFGLFLVAGAPPLVARPRQESQDGPRLAAVVVNGREVAIGDLWQLEGTLWVPLPAFAEWTGATLEQVGGVYRLRTSLGQVEVDAQESRLLDGVPHVNQLFLEKRLAAKVSFNEARLALTLDLPWGAMAVGEDAVRPAPEVRAPAASLSILREDFAVRRSEGSSTANSSTTIAGRLAGGRFRMRYDTAFEDAGSFSEAAWSRNVGPAMVMAGYQNVLVNPLLGAGSFTGLQGAWTNQPFDIFPQGVEGRELLPRRVTPRRTFRGRGPVAGKAVLRVDGSAIERMTIGLDGVWEFLEVPLPARTAVRVEVHLYAREDLLVPIAIEEQTLSVSESLLPKGAVVALGGAGAAGNLITESIGGARGPSGGFGFVTARAGLTDRLTIEGSGRLDRDRWQGLAGLTAGIGSTAAVGVSVAAGNGGFGYRADVSWVEARFRLNGFSQVREGGFLAEGSAREVEHFGEASYKLGPGIEIALVGRDRRFGEDSLRFLRPGFTVRPLRGVVARAWPDFDGTYRYDLFARFARGTLVAATYRDFARIDVSTARGADWRFSAGTEFAGDQATRFSAVVHWYRPGVAPFDLGAGTVWSAGKWGVYGSVHAPVFGGLLLTAEVQSVPLSRTRDSEVSPVVIAGLSTNLGFAGSRIVAGDTGTWQSGRGAIAGRLRVEGAGKGWSLADVAIRVGGQILTRSLPGGSFFVADLPEGVHVVEIDDARLPIELIPTKKQYSVEVVSGAVTRVDFGLRAQFSVAGQVTCRGEGPLEEVAVELLDGDGKPVAASQTDSFGLYRLDGVPPGSYRVRATIRGSREPSVRTVVVIDDFLFGQDLEAVCEGRGVAPNP